MKLAITGLVAGLAIILVTLLDHFGLVHLGGWAWLVALMGAGGAVVVVLDMATTTTDGVLAVAPEPPRTWARMGYIRRATGRRQCWQVAAWERDRWTAGNATLPPGTVIYTEEGYERRAS